MIAEKLEESNVVLWTLEVATLSEAGHERPQLNSVFLQVQVGHSKDKYQRGLATSGYVYLLRFLQRCVDNRRACNA